MENGEQKTCQVKMYDGEPCGRPLYPQMGGSKCICHSEDQAKHVGLFQEELDKIFAGDEEAEYYDLTEFIFPKEGYKLPKEYKKDTYFQGATFSGAVDFSGATFSGEAYFESTTFSEEADFHWATFSAKAHFNWATFSEDANFRCATVSGEADFHGTTFLEVADFIDATFSEEANFRWATFSGTTQFYSTHFEKRVDFSFCRADKDADVTFDGENLLAENKQMFPEGADFASCAFASPQNIKFRKLSLEKCKFLESDISAVQFIDVKWASMGKRLKRKVIFDAISPDLHWLEWQREKEEEETEEDADTEKQESEPPIYQYNLIAQIYRRLQTNYVNNYRYSEAGDFYIGEQEMVRKAKGKIGQYLSTNFLYKIISYYGESFMLPLLWLAFILLLFPAGLLLDGINLNPTLQDPAVVETVNYEWSWSPGDFLPANSDSRCDYWEAFVVNFSLIAYSRSDIGKYLPESHSRFIVTIESLVIIALLAFFLLALRRQYKRKTF